MNRRQAVASIAAATVGAAGLMGVFGGQNPRTWPEHQPVSVYAEAQPDCAQRPSHWKCRTPTPTRTRTPAPTATPVPRTPTPTATPAPQASILWGSYVIGWPNTTTAALDQFERDAGKRMSLVHWGAPWMHTDAYVPFQRSTMEAVRLRGAIPLLSWMSWDLIDGMAQPTFQLADITRGDHDAFLRQWARDAAAWGHPLFLYYNPEFNGTWYPFAETNNGNQAGDFAPHWRHVVDVFEQEGATNVLWVWCPNIIPAGRQLNSLYPGDAYVDWTCMDGFNWAGTRNEPWLTFDQVFRGTSWNWLGDTYAELLDVAPTKPIMIGQTASTELGGDKAAWITDALDPVKLRARFPQVKALVWFNWNTDGADWEITTSEAARAAFEAAIADPYFRAANE